MEETSKFFGVRFSPAYPTSLTPSDPPGLRGDRLVITRRDSFDRTMSPVRVALHRARCRSLARPPPTDKGKVVGDVDRVGDHISTRGAKVHGVSEAHEYIP